MLFREGEWGFHVFRHAPVVYDSGFVITFLFFIEYVPGISGVCVTREMSPPLGRISIDIVV